MSSELLTSSSTDYHANKTHLSSSALKLLLKSPSEFYAQYIEGQRIQTESAAFDEGSFVHSLILEPHKITAEYAIYPGLVKRGRAWEAFKAANADKKLLSIAQLNRCEKLARSLNAMPTAVKMLENGLPEHTMISTLLDVPVKCRADFINIDEGYIVDIKTTGMPSDAEVFTQTIEQYAYELSAALYCQIAADTYKKDFDFYWLVLSKIDNRCEIYKASGPTLSRGAALYKQALLLYKQYTKTGIWAYDQPPSSFETSQYEIIEI